MARDLTWEAYTRRKTRPAGSTPAAPIVGARPIGMGERSAPRVAAFRTRARHEEMPRALTGEAYIRLKWWVRVPPRPLGLVAQWMRAQARTASRTRAGQTLFRTPGHGLEPHGYSRGNPPEGGWLEPAAAGFVFCSHGVPARGPISVP